jgi:hypothetical protein
MRCLIQYSCLLEMECLENSTFTYTVNNGQGEREEKNVNESSIKSVSKFVPHVVLKDAFFYLIRGAIKRKRRKKQI